MAHDRLPASDCAAGLVFGLLALTLSGPLCAETRAEAAMQISGRAGLDRLVEEGFDRVYNLDYDGAAVVFRRVIAENPEDPAGYCYLSTTVWLRYLHERQELELDNFTSAAYFGRKPDQAVDPGTQREFDGNVGLAMAKAEAMLAKNPKDARALYYLGAAYGNVAAFHATAQRSLWTAFRNGSKAFDCHKRVLQLDPEFHDANLALGLYDYVAGSIPWSVRWLAALAGFRGNRERGLERLILAAEKGRYNSRDAKVIASVLLVREKQYQRALTYLSALHREYPQNYLLHVDLAGTQMMAGRFQEAAENYREILIRIDRGSMHYERLRRPQVALRLGHAYLKAEQLSEARDVFERLLEAADGGSSDMTLVHLRMGQLEDLADRRSHAVRHYQRVLALPDVRDSRDEARRYLKTPYRL